MIQRELFRQVQETFQSKGKATGNARQNLAYIGILTCGDCGFAIKAEKKKGRYAYYRCSNYHRPCPSKRMREL